MSENGIFFLLGDDVDTRASAIDELRQLSEICLKLFFLNKDILACYIFLLILLMTGHVWKRQL
jgi:hypothetical protein